MPTKSKTLRDANRIKQLAEEILNDFDNGVGSDLYQPDISKLEEIRDLAGGLDASTGKRGTSTKKRRRAAAKKASYKAPPRYVKGSEKS